MDRQSIKNIHWTCHGLMPFDKWMGTWHDGTEEGDQVMKDRFQRKKARQMGKSASDTKDSMQ